MYRGSNIFVSPFVTRYFYIAVSGLWFCFPRMVFVWKFKQTKRGNHNEHHGTRLTEYNAGEGRGG